MGETTALRRELKRTWIPLLESKGFVVDQTAAPMFMRFRRADGDTVHLLEIQWEKYGRPRFAINFGTCPSEGLQIGGERFPVEKVYVGWLEEHGRLQPRRGRNTPGLFSQGWFSQEPSLLQRWFGKEKSRTPEKVVQRLMSLLPEIEDYWASRAVGAHLMIIRIPRQS
jgi:hypothetical protein